MFFFFGVFSMSCTMTIGESEVSCISFYSDLVFSLRWIAVSTEAALVLMQR